MGTLTALVLAATPIFGLSLTPPQLEALPESLVAHVAPLARLDASLDEEAEVSSDDEEEVQKGPVLSKEEFKLQLRKRAKLATIHRTLGITTWALTGLAVIAGTIQWRNLYAGGEGSNPCVTGDAWLGQKQCYGTPWFHALTGFGAGAAYFSTLGIALAMPDPDNAARGDSKYAKTLRTHKALRWVHLSGMVLQMVLGIVIANPKLNGGLDRANDYGTLKALSIVHLASGYMTLGALSWAGTIMLK
jgi:cytochrome b561